MWQVEGAQTPNVESSGVVQPDGVVPFPEDADPSTLGDQRCEPSNRHSTRAPSSLTSCRCALDEMFAAGKLIWHHDSIEFAPPTPSPADMWATWSFGTDESATVVDDPLGPWWVKYDSVREWGVQTPIVPLRQIATLEEGSGLWRLNPA